jgi:hypothetical protein
LQQPIHIAPNFLEVAKITKAFKDVSTATTSLEMNHPDRNYRQQYASSVDTIFTHNLTRVANRPTGPSKAL